MVKRRFYLVLLMAMLACSGKMNAQIFKGEVFAGASLSQIDGDECFGYRRFTGQAGVGAMLPVTDWFDIALEVMYNPKGALRNDTMIANSGSFHGLYDCKLNYVEIPLMFYFTDKQRYTIGIGAAYGRLVGLSEKINGTETGITVGDGYLRWPDGYQNGFDLSYIKSAEDLDDPAFYYNDSVMILQNSNSYKKNDISICADLRIRIWEGLHLQFRYQYSLVPIRTRLFEEYNPYLTYNVRLQYNNQIALRLTYIFGEDRSKLNKEIQKEEKRQRR